MNIIRRFAGILTPVLLAMLAQQVPAADLRVRVFERGGNTPLAGVGVCVGTQAKPEQFGAMTTDASGYVLFESLPRAQLLVTASMSGYKSEQEQLITSNTDRMLVLSMSHGGGGPECMTVKTGRSIDTGSPVVTSFAINRGGASTATRKVSLDNRVRGKVTQYRASERADFSDAQWQDYSASPVYMLSEGSGRKTVYFQVRRHSALGDAVVEAPGAVVSDSVLLQSD